MFILKITNKQKHLFLATLKFTKMWSPKVGKTTLLLPIIRLFVHIMILHLGVGLYFRRQHSAF